MLLIWHYESKRQERKWRHKLQNKQQRNMEENYCQRMKHFVLVDHVRSHLLLSKARSSVLFSSGACRTATHLPELGPVELFSILGGNTRQQKAKGEMTGADQASCTTAVQGLWATPGWVFIQLSPKAAAAFRAECRRSETPWFYCHSEGLCHIFQMHFWGYRSLACALSTV